jgi:hypothetical protein
MHPVTTLQACGTPDCHPGLLLATSSLVTELSESETKGASLVFEQFALEDA